MFEIKIRQKVSVFVTRLSFLLGVYGGRGSSGPVGVTVVGRDITV